jgi:hypothetical protein
VTQDPSRKINAPRPSPFLWTTGTPLLPQEDYFCHPDALLLIFYISFLKERPGYKLSFSLSCGRGIQTCISFILNRHMICILKKKPRDLWNVPYKRHLKDYVLVYSTIVPVVVN